MYLNTFFYRKELEVFIFAITYFIIYIWSITLIQEVYFSKVRHLENF